MAVIKLYEVGMRTAPKHYRDRKGEVTRNATTRNTVSRFHLAAADVSFATDLHAGTVNIIAVETHQLPYSKNQQIPNNESSSLSTIHLAGFNSIATHVSREAQDPQCSVTH